MAIMVDMSGSHRGIAGRRSKVIIGRTVLAAILKPVSIAESFARLR
jgi:hypothetical protein